MLSALLALVMFQDATLPLTVSNGGFCTGIAWVSVPSADGLTVDHGPEFRVYRYHKSGGEWWGIYSGNASQVSNGEKKLLLERDGVKVSAVTIDGKFRYIAVTKEGWQNHFFGSLFKNAPSDIRFFDKVDFGRGGQSKCERHRS